jgi:hypothetical protein
VRIGPLAFTPAVTVKNLGWDNNVFNDVTDLKGDFIAAGGPQVRWWMRLARVRFIGKDSLEGTYFARYVTERSLNHRHDLRIEYRFSRLRPYVLGSYASMKDRTGYEIDVRAHHTESTVGAGLEWPITSKTRIDIVGLATTYRFQGKQTFENTDLAENLNRKGALASATLSYFATPLTTLSIRADAGQQRFAGSPVRDNDSIRVMPGVSLDPLALIKGTARVGYGRVDMVSPSLPDYAGLVADVNLSYVLLGRTRFSLTFLRDIAYSYYIAEPYYLLTGVTGAVRQGFGNRWDVEARGSSQELAYRRVLTIDGSSKGRIDHVQSYGGGIGFRLGRQTRVSADIDAIRRRSGQLPSYKSTRIGISASYEF